MILISRSPVEFKRGIVLAVNFKMDGIYAHLACFLFDKSNRLPAKSAAAVGGVNIQFVDEGIVTVEFETETHRQDDVSSRLLIFAEKPHAPKCRQGQKFPEGSACRGLVKFDDSRLLLGKNAHHAEELRFVLEGRLADPELRHVTHRFVQ